MLTNVPGIEGERRLHPRFWDYNYYMMKGIGNSVRGAVETRIPLGSQSCVVDLGCGTRPYGAVPK